MWTRFAALLLLPCYLLYADPVAFNGAEGFGSTAQGGVEVYQVTSLADSLTPEPGTLRYALEVLERPLNITFGSLSGEINLVAPIKVQRPHITISADLLSVQGITLKGYGLCICGTHDVVVRNIRIQDTGNVLEEYDCSLCIEYSDNIILDHLTLLHSTDSGCKITSSRNVTVQWCLIAETFADIQHNEEEESEICSGFGFKISDNVGNITCHHNLLISNICGNPLITNPLNDAIVDFRNNVIYNYGQNAGIALGSAKLNAIGNYYKIGPCTSPCLGFSYFSCGTETQLYTYSNVVVGTTTPTVKGVVGGIRRTEPFPAAAVTTQPVIEAFNSVCEKAGVNYVSRSSAEARLVAEVKIVHGNIPGVN